MASFAKLKNNIVQQVIVVHDNEVPTEEQGIRFLKSLYPNEDCTWVQTDDNVEAKFRKNRANIGDTYDKNLDAFIPACRFKSWTFNKETCRYDPPVPRPAHWSRWNEEKQKWDLHGIDY